MMHARRRVRSEVVRQAKYAEDVLTVRLEDISFCASVKEYSVVPKLSCTRPHLLNYNFSFCLIILVYSDTSANEDHSFRDHIR